MQECFEGVSVLLQSSPLCTFHLIVNTAQGLKLYRVIQMPMAKLWVVIAEIVLSTKCKQTVV
jgi:hypothetical protein